MGENKLTSQKRGVLINTDRKMFVAIAAIVVFQTYAPSELVKVVSTIITFCILYLLIKEISFHIARMKRLDQRLEEIVIRHQECIRKNNR